MSLDERIGGTLDEVRPAEEWVILDYHYQDTNVTIANPGASYAEWKASGRHKIDFGRIPANQIKVSVYGSGGEAGTPKGIEVYDVTNSQQLCEITWSGAGSGGAMRESSWTDLPSNVINGGEVEITIRTKGSSATEDLTLARLCVQLRRN